MSGCRCFAAYTPALVFLYMRVQSTSVTRPQASRQPRAWFHPPWHWPSAATVLFTSSFFVAPGVSAEKEQGYHLGQYRCVKETQNKMKIVDLLFLLLLEDVGSEPWAVELSLCFGFRLPQEESGRHGYLLLLSLTCCIFCFSLAPSSSSPL